MTLQTWNSVASRSLEMRTSLTLVTPDGPGDFPQTWPQNSEAETGLLVLLHGLTGNSTQWLTYTDLVSVANKHNVVIAMPDGHRSFWLNQAYGLKYGDWVGEELPTLLRSMLRISSDRSRTYVGGLSMGGYGAMRAAFDHPEIYGSAFSLSGTLDVAEEAFRKRHQDLYLAGFGNAELPRPEDDLVSRVQNADEGVARVELFACCGTEDHLLEQNRLFVEAAGAAGVELTYREGPGMHDFAFWSSWLPIAMDTLNAK